MQLIKKLHVSVITNTLLVTVVMFTTVQHINIPDSFKNLLYLLLLFCLETGLSCPKIYFWGGGFKNLQW